MTRERMQEMIDRSPFTTKEHVKYVVEMYSHLVPFNHALTGMELAKKMREYYANPIIDFLATISEAFIIDVGRGFAGTVAHFTKTREEL